MADKKKKKWERLTPEQLDTNYKDFIKGKDLKDNGRQIIEKLLKRQ